MADVTIKVDTEAKTASLNDVVQGLSRVEEGLTKTTAAAEKTVANTSRLEAVFRSVAAKGIALFAELARESVDAALENERAVTRLRRVAGEYTSVLEAQADAAQIALNVSGEMVMGLQEMALRFDVVPAKVDSLTRAVIDYSKATGLDAQGAMRHLLMGLENGGAGLQRMGLAVDATKSKAEQLNQAIEQLTSRWGGAAAADAETLTGKVEALKLAWGELLETVGKGLLAGAVAFDTWLAKGTGWTSTIKGLTAALNDLAGASSEERWRTLRDFNLTAALFGVGEAQTDAAVRAEALVAATNRVIEARRTLKAVEATGRTGWAHDETKAFWETQLKEAQTAEAQARAAIGVAQKAAQAELPSLLSRLMANYSAKAREGLAAQMPLMSYEIKLPDKSARERVAKQAAEEAEEAGRLAEKQRELRKKASEDRAAWQVAEAEGAEEFNAQQEALSGEETSRWLQSWADSFTFQKEALEQGYEDLKDAAEAAEAERQQLQSEKDMEALRKRQDFEGKLKDVAIRAAEESLSAVGRIVDGMRQAKERQAAAMADVNERYKADMEEARRYSGEKSEQLGREALQRLQKGMKAAAKENEFRPTDVIKDLVPALVQLALSFTPASAFAPFVGAAVRMLLNSFHEGGWVGDSPPVSPAQRPAMLLDGERVLSHREVRAMGGPAVVDAAAQGRPVSMGGGTVTLQVAAFDADSFRQWLSAEGGQGLARALLGGRGEAAQLLQRLARKR